MIQFSLYSRLCFRPWLWSHSPEAIPDMLDVLNRMAESRGRTNAANIEQLSEFRFYLTITSPIRKGGAHCINCDP